MSILYLFIGFMLTGIRMSIIVVCIHLFAVFGGGFVGAFSIDDVIDFPYEGGNEDTAGQEATDLGQVIKDSSVNDDKGIVKQIMEAFGIDYTSETDQTATFYVKEIINWLLVIIGLVALVSLLWGFYKMLLSKDSEEGYTSAKKIVGNAVLAIFIIGLSWFLVSWFFAIYNATLSTTAG